MAGFITRGYGVSVHRTDCPNYLSSVSKPEDAGRWIAVSWGDTKGETYQTSLSLSSRDRNGLVMDVATVFNALKIKVNSLSAHSTGNGDAVVYLSIVVKDLDELSLAMARLSGIRGVSEVKRSGAK